MTDDNLDLGHLLKLADAASRWTWRYTQEDERIVSIRDRADNMDDLQYLAAMHPGTTKALIARVRELEALLYAPPMRHLCATYRRLTPSPHQPLGDGIITALILPLLDNIFVVLGIQIPKALPLQLW